jgi:hypothetical protein
MKMTKTKKDAAPRRQMPSAESSDMQPAKPAAENNVFNINVTDMKDGDAAIARVRMHPVFGAASTVRYFEKPLAEHNFVALVDELTSHVEAIKAGNMNRPETMLLMQAHTLDVIFNSLVQRAGANVGNNIEYAERCLRMGLRAQMQCRATLETLAEIKSPKSAIFAKQANVGQNVQVNNRNPDNSTRAREKDLDRSNELLKESPNATLDTGRTGTASGNDPQLEAVGAIDGTANEDRKAAQQQ